jgi:hypothetical protein
MVHEYSEINGLEGFLFGGSDECGPDHPHDDKNCKNEYAHKSESIEVILRAS